MTNDWLEGKVKISGKEYRVAVIKGVRYIDGKTVDSFFKTLSPKEKVAFSIVGLEALQDELKSNKPIPRKYQNILSELMGEEK